MPSKKKKYNSRFPPARIKKIMQTDEEIGKVAAAVPVLISKCLEMFLASLLTKAGDVTKSKRAKTMTRSHLKQCILSEAMFDFLKDHVANIPDIQNEDEPSGSLSYVTEKDHSKKVVRKRSLPKVKKTPKKRAKLGHTASNNNDSDGQTDSADEASENGGSGNEGSDAIHSSSFSSPGLLSPSLQKKLDAQHSSSLAQTPNESETVKEKKPSFHIPLDALLSNNKVLASVEIKEPLLIAEDETEAASSSEEVKCDMKDRKNDDGQLKRSNTDIKSEILSPVNVKPPQDTVVETHVSPIVPAMHNASAVRQGVIVANTVAYPVSVSSTTMVLPHQDSLTLPYAVPGCSGVSGDKKLSMPQQESKYADSTSTSHASGMKKQNDFVKKFQSETIKVDVAQTETVTVTDQQHSQKGIPPEPEKAAEGRPLPTAMPPPQPGSMLSFLYSSVSMPISSIHMPTTVTPATPVTSSQETYTYSPLSQHQLSRPNKDGIKQTMYPSVAPNFGEVPRAPYLKSFPSQNQRMDATGPANSDYTLPRSAAPNFHPSPMTYPYQYPPYNPNSSTSYASQRHYLGYPQSILTPTGHPLPQVSSQYAAHPSLCLVKPTPKSMSDDDDDYDQSS